MIIAAIAIAVPASRQDAQPGDMSREHKGFFEWAPSRSLLASIRSYQRWRSSRWPWAIPMRKLAVLRHRFWSIVTAADIPLDSRIGLGLQIPHPTGVVINPKAVIGPNCFILSCVTIGNKRAGVPTIGMGVTICTGAKILGGVHIGDHAVIGAGAVVLRDVKPWARVVGIPAREITRLEV